MARNSNATGYVPTATQHFVERQYIRESDHGTNSALKALPLNDNTYYAQLSPPLFVYSCHNAANNYTNHAGAWAATPYFATRHRIGRDDRATLRFCGWAKIDAGTTGEIGIKSVGAAATTSVVVNNVNWTWFTGTRAFTVDGSGYDIFTVNLRTTAGAGDVYLRSVSAWIEEASNPLSSGAQTSGVIHQDTDESNADNPLPVTFVRRYRTNSELYLDGTSPFYKPIMGWSIPLDQYITKAMGHYTQETEWVNILIPLCIPRQYNLSAIRYSIFAIVDGGGSGEIRIRNLDTSDATEHALQAVGTYNVETDAQWLSGTIPIRPLPEVHDPSSFVYDRFTIETYADTPDAAYVLAVVLSEE
jgi:hypothetical protein